MPSEGLVTPFLGALQACVSVLLTMCYGVAARRLHLIQEITINDMLGPGVKLLLPALVVVHLGQQLHLGTAMNYIPVIRISTPLLLILRIADLECYRNTSLVNLLHICIHRSFTRYIANTISTSMGHASLRIQQHHISPFTPPLVPRKRRKSQADSPQRRKHVLGHRPSPKLFPRLRHNQQNNRVHRRT